MLTFLMFVIIILLNLKLWTLIKQLPSHKKCDDLVQEPRLTLR